MAPERRTTETPIRPEFPTNLDKVAITAFDGDLIDPHTVRIRMKIKNLGATVLSGVPWIIRESTPGGWGSTQNVLAYITGTVDLPAIGEVTVEGYFNVAQFQTGRITLRFGSLAYAGTVDPGQTLRELITLDNTKGCWVRIFTTAAPLIQKTLSRDLARDAGATFQDRPQNAPTDGSLGQGGVMVSDVTPTSGLPHGVMVPAFFCRGGPALGNTGDLDALASFQLKHGWKIKSVDMRETQKSGNAGWNWVAEPPIGDSNPYMRVHLWADRNSSISLMAIAVIEGQADQDPYQA